MNHLKQERVKQLRAQIQECKDHKATIEKNVAKIATKAADAGWSASQTRERLNSYLRDKSYEEWMLLYDEIIREKQDELEAYVRLPTVREQQTKRNTLLTASAITCAFLLILALFFLPKPLAVLTGNAIGTGDQLAELITDAQASTAPTLISTKQGLFPKSTVTPLEPGAAVAIGNDENVLDVLVTRDTTLSAYETPVELVYHRATLLERTAQYRIKNTKALGTGYLLLTPGYELAIQDDRDNAVEFTRLGVVDDFVTEWNDASTLLGTVKEELENAGAETRLDRIFPAQHLPVPGETLELFAYPHPSDSWMTVTTTGPSKRGRLLFLDPAGAWWNESWAWRTPVFIEEQAGENLTNYSVRIELNSTNFDFSKALSDGADVRVTLNTTGTEQEGSHWIEYWYNSSQNASLWVFIPELNQSTNMTIYLYYGNGLANDTSDADAVFELYMNFTRDGLSSYGGQDITPTSYLVINDTSLRQWNNSWKASFRNITVAGDGSQVVEYWFLGDSEGELHGPGFDNDDATSSGTTYRIWGRDTNFGTVGNITYNGPGWELITETLDDFSGTFDRLVFMADDDSQLVANATFRHFRVRAYESPEPSVTVQQEERAAVYNVSLDEPPNATREYRGEAFTMNGTISCERGDCGNTTAWSQFYSTLSPTTTWTETSTADFTSYNTSVNITIGSDGFFTIAANITPTWWDARWRYRVKLNISNPNAQLTNYSFNLTMDTNALIAAGKLQDDCADLRFTNATAGELSYWIETGCNSSATNIWIRADTLAATSNTTLYAYYGNPSADAGTDPDAVFTVFINYTRDGHSGYTDNDHTPSQNEIINDTSLHQWGDTWRQTFRSVNVTGDGSQVLEYWYEGLSQGELMGAGLDDDEVTSSGTTYRIWGRDSNFGIVGNDTYGGSGWEFISEQLDDFSGTFDRFVWMADDDSQSVANHTFRNVRIRPYTSNEPSLALEDEEDERIHYVNGTYISSPYDTGSSGNTFETIYWSASTPTNTTLRVYTRSSADNLSWSSWFQEVNNTSVDAPSQQHVQYKIEMETDNATWSPTFYEMNIEYKYTTQGWKAMDGSTGLVATNPYECGNLTSSSANCTPTWSVTPQQLGTYALRILANNSEDATSNGTTTNNTIDVYARTYLLELLASPSTQARDANITFRARLLNDLSQAVQGALINFTDLTDGVNLGTNATNAQGYAYLTVTINDTASLGDHTLNITYDGNTTAFIEADDETLVYRVSSTPNVTNETATPSMVGIRDPVVITTNVTDAVGVDSVWVNITKPDSTWQIYDMTPTGGTGYSYTYNDTWLVGFYEFKISANNTDGIIVDPPGNFTVNATGSIHIDPEFATYKNFETVNLASRRWQDWYNTSWLYRQTIDVTASNTDLYEYQVEVVLDTQTLISEGKLNDNCSDLRFTGNNYSNGAVMLDHYLEWGCNETNTTILVQVDHIPAGNDTTIHVYYGNPGAPDISNLTAVMSYATPRTMGYVLSNLLASNGFMVYSLVDDNNVSVGATSAQLNISEFVSIASASMSTEVKATRPIMVEGTADGSDIIAPASWAGTEFIYNWRRGTDDFHFLSPWGTANVTIYDNGSVVANFQVGATGLFVDDTYDITDLLSMRIVSDIPILVHHSQGTSDAAPLYPTTTEPVYGVPSRFLGIGSGPNGATIQVNRSAGGALADIVLGTDEAYDSGDLGGAKGATAAYRLEPNASDEYIGAIQQADDDGTETTIFLPERQLGTLFGSNITTDHIAIAAPTLGTNCTVYNSTGGQIASALSSGNSLISKIGFGTGDDNTFALPGWIMRCDYPVWATYEKDVTEDESNMLSIREMRQYHYPPPNATVDNTSEEQVYTGLQNIGDTNMTGYLFLAVQGNSTGSWEFIGAPVYQDITERTIDPNTVLNISPIWDTSGAWLTSTRSPGWYRVYAAFRDNESNILNDSRGVQLLDTGLFEIVEALLRLNNLSHENEYESTINEYEAGDLLDWVNVTIQAKNNTAISATINLTLLNGSGLYPGWGPMSAQSCGNIDEGDNCTRRWDNSTNGYPIPLSVPSGSYTFTWRVNMTSDNGPSAQNSSLTVTVHNTPSTFQSSIAPTRIFTNGTPATYTFNMTTLWSENLTAVTIRLNYPLGIGLNATCIAGGTPTGDGACTLTQWANDTSISFQFNISANTTATQGDYYINVTVNYTNPGNEVRIWNEQEPRLLEVREEGIIAITVTSNPSNLTRGQSGLITAYVNNTGADNATNVTVNYTMPSPGWTNTSPLDVLFLQINASDTEWHNLSFTTSQSAALGPQQVLIESGSDTGQNDFKYVDITIYANTSTRNVTVNDTNASRGEMVRFNATLRYDNGTPISGATINFTDLTDSVNIGTAVTNSQGMATRTWLIPAGASFGVHTINASYAGSATLYTLLSWNTTLLDIGLVPNISSVWASPDPQGQGSNVTIYANVTDDDTLDDVLLTVTAPNGTVVLNNQPMSFSAGLYNYTFEQTWYNGTYTYTVRANDSTGSASEQGSSFLIENEAFIAINVTAANFSQNENVTLQGHSAGWWWAKDWKYRQSFTITEQDGLSLNDTQVNITIDTATLVSQGKLDVNCTDLRLIDESTGTSLSYWRGTDCNTSTTELWVKLATLDANSDVNISIYYGNSGASSGTNVSRGEIFSGIQVVVSDSLATGDLNISGMHDNTTVCVNGADCHVLNQSDIYTIRAANLTTNTTISATKPVGSGFLLTGIGSPLTPLAWMGRNFTYPAPRDTQSLDVYSPYQVANVSLYDGSGYVSSVIVQPGQTAEINYNPADGPGQRLLANASVLAHYEGEAGNNDYLPLYPESNGLYGIESGSTNGAYREIACGVNNTNLTVYFSNGSTWNWPDCDAYTTVDLGGGSGAGNGVTSYAVANNSQIGGMTAADGDGTEGVLHLPLAAMDNYYVLPQPAEYVSLVAREPSTYCELRDSEGLLIGSSTSTSYTPPRPQGVIRFTGSPIEAGARIQCDNDVWAYYESYEEDAETILLGAKTWRNRGPSLPSISSSAEETYGSLLSNTGSTALRGLLHFLIQRNISGGWQWYATVRNDTANNTIQTLAPQEYLDLATMWNESPWDSGNSPAGKYRAYVELVAPDGHILMSTTQELWNASSFNITPPNLELNLTKILVYDVTNSLNKHTYSANLTGNSTNDTFIMISGHAYRIELHVLNTANSTLWNLSNIVVTHEDLNDTWIIDAAADIWYQNESDVSERLGGTWNGTVEWNTSGKDGLADVNTTVVFSYVLNLTGATAEDVPVLFLVDDPALQIQDNSIYRIQLLDTTPPRIYNNTYNLTNTSILRGENTTIFGRWDETLSNATVAYNSTSPLVQNYTITLPEPNPRNWSNHTIVTSALWTLGTHVAKLYAADEQDNWNQSLEYLNFTVWGLAQVVSSSITDTLLNLSDNTTLTCRVMDDTNSQAIQNYVVRFYNGTDFLGDNITNSTGHARFTYQDFSAGTENFTCNITMNASRYYQVDSQNQASYELTTLESEPPWADNVQANVTIAHKGDTVKLAALWHDNFQLNTATLATNASGSWANVSNLSLSGTDAWANFSYVIPNNFAPGYLGWRQYGNDTSNNVNVTPDQSLEVWGWAIVESILLEPAFIYTTNTTNITCRVVDEQNNSGISGYNVSFYNATDYLGWNTTNASGHARFNYTDYSSGIETMRCQIGDEPTLMYNASSPNNRTASLTTGDSGDIQPPYVINGNYGLNDTVVKKGENLTIFAEWNEYINRSVARYNTTDPTIRAFNVSSPYTNNWTNHTIETNSSWIVGRHVAKLEATDLSNNTNTTAEYLWFNVTATSQITWISPTGSVYPTNINLTCRVTEEENGQGIDSYTVYFYNDTGGLIGTPTTNATGHARIEYDTAGYDGNYDFSCRIFSAPSKFYYIGSNFQDEETLLFDGVEPNIQLNAPLDGNITSETTLNLSFTVTDTHDSTLDCNVTVDDSVISTTTATSGVQKDVEDTFGYGLHYWNVTCWDDVGNINTSVTWSFNITSPDSTAPTLQLLSPDDDAYVNSSTVVFQYNTTDDVEVQNCSLYIDGVLNQTDPAPVEGGDSFTVNGLAEGSHTWYVICRDASFNENQSETRVFTVDTIAPASFDLVTPANYTVTGDLTPTMEWQETTDDNFWNYTLQVSSSPIFSAGVTTEYVTFTINDTNRTLLPLQMNKAYYWRVIASDRAGWTTTSDSTYQYITDDQPPVVLLISPPDGDNDPDGNLTLVYQPNDNNISNCSLYTNITGVWQEYANDTAVEARQHNNFTLTGLPLGSNFTFIWNVLCYDSLGYSDWAVRNWTVHIQDFNETHDNMTIPTNATVTNALPYTRSVIPDNPIDLIAGGQQIVNCTANVSDDNGAADIIDAQGWLFRDGLARFDPDNATNHYTNGSCGACTTINETSARCTCSFNMWYYAEPGWWRCHVAGVDNVGVGSSFWNFTYLNQLQAVDVRPTLLDYGNVLGGVPSGEENVSVINFGNVALDVDLWAYGATQGDNLSMECKNGGNITVSAERFSTSQGTAYASMTPLTGELATAPTANLNVPPQTGPDNSSLPLYWRIQSGAGAVGECNGTIVFHAQIG